MQVKLSKFYYSRGEVRIKDRGQCVCMELGVTADDFSNIFYEVFVERLHGFLGDDNSTGKDLNTS